MQQFARGMGILSVITGILLLAFPEGTRRMMKAREEYARLSPGALRLLGAWELMMGALLVSTTTPSAAEMRARETVAPQLRRAA